MKKIILLICVLFVFIACSSTKTNPAAYTKNVISFGNGGGFAGIENGYVLLENGEIFQVLNLGKEYKKVRKLPSNQTKQIFRNYKFLNFDSVELNKPDNTYKFITFSIDKTENRIAWSGDDQATNANLMHSILMNTIKK